MIDKLKIFNSQFPSAYYFDADTLERLPAYLREKDLISGKEKLISFEKPGEGNMNFVIRVITDKISFIMKQSRPWVEKYPQIEAPVERLAVEYTYFNYLSKDPFFSIYSPKVLLYDPVNLVLVTQDLGKGSDFSFCYQKSKSLSNNQLKSLLKYIAHLHRKDWRGANVDFPLNTKLKKLNHEHIFQYPFLQDNGFDLDSIQAGLQQLSLPLKNNKRLKFQIAKLGDKYLSAGPVLIHGDYYPGSWLDINQQVKVIDPEFAFFGFAEFDLGVMTAHLLMAGLNLVELKELLQNYNKRLDFDQKLFYGFCGTEILRRIIGLAQLPLDLSLGEKERLLKLAESFIVSPDSSVLF